MPWLTCSPYPADVPKPTSFLVTMDGAPAVESTPLVNADGSVQLRHDLAGISDGPHSAVVVAKNGWGESSPSSPFAFASGAPGAPSLDLLF